MFHIRSEKSSWYLTKPASQVVASGGCQSVEQDATGRMTLDSSKSAMVPYLIQHIEESG